MDLFVLQIRFFFTCTQKEQTKKILTQIGRQGQTSFPHIQKK